MKKYFMILTILAWFGSLLFIYNESRSNVEQKLVTSLKANEREITQLLNIAIAYNVSIRDQLISNFNANKSGHQHPLTSKLKDFSELDTYGLEGNETVNGRPYTANLTGIGSLSNVTPAVLSEIDSVLAVNVAAPFSDNRYNFIWSYYTSKNGFLLLAPRVGIQDFQFAEYNYKKPFWRIATPEHNPTREPAISDLYDDAAGKGLMISISTPVYSNENFKGVVSLDVGIDYLNEVLDSGALRLNDNLSLVTETGISAIHGAHINQENLRALLQNQHVSPHQLVRHNGDNYIFSNLIKDKFYASYSLGASKLNALILKNAYKQILISSLFAVIIWLVILLYSMLSATRKLAELDGLSKLYNRRTLEELSNDLFITKENDEPISIIMIDIDHFKAINDKYGHDVGDKGIIHVANLIKQTVRKTDITGRYGGEEFTVTMPGATQEQARDVAERIRRVVEHTKFSKDLAVTVSIGIAESNALDVSDFQNLCIKSDLALYKAKQDGRNRLVIYQSELERYGEHAHYEAC